MLYVDFTLVCQFDHILPNGKCYVSLQTHFNRLGITIISRIESQTKVVKAN